MNGKDEHFRPARRPTTTESASLFREAAADSPEAQSELHRRYAARMVSLIRSRLRDSVRSRFDAEDVVNSAFRSFFAGLSEGQFLLPPTGGLWPLLAQISLHKLHRTTEHHHREKRSVASESIAAEPDADRWDASDAEAIVRDELRWLAERLSEPAFATVALSVEGFSGKEIASQLQVSDRTVRRYLCESRALLRSRLTSATEVGNRPESVATETADDLRFDDYLLRRMVGAGRFGRVYLATEKSTGRDVAIKYLRKRWTDDARIRRQFDQEASVLREMKIRGVIASHGSGETPSEGRFIVMDWVDGGNLAETFARGNHNVNERIERFAELADTLHHVHQHGMLHRDLKPANVLVDRGTGRWMLTDFGLAVSNRSSTPLDLQGTPAYMAAEQFDPFFGPIGPWTDVYSIGVMLFESLCGVPRFSTDSVEELVHQVTESDGAEVATILGGRHPAPLIELIGATFVRRTRDRIGSAGELSQRLATLGKRS